MDNKIDFGNSAIEHMNKHYLKKSAHGELYKFWGSKDAQLLRFKLLFEIGDLDNRSVLDVGCGLGEFYHFCKEKGASLIEYVGIDINSEIVAQANENFPELNLLCMDITKNTFEVNGFDYVVASPKFIQFSMSMDITKNTFEVNGFDYVAASGLFNFECTNWNERVQFIIGECYKISRLGVAVNFLRFRKENRNPIAHYVRYDDILKIVELHTNRFMLRADYKKNDFTVYMYKELLK